MRLSYHPKYVRLLLSCIICIITIVLNVLQQPSHHQLLPIHVLCNLTPLSVCLSLSLSCSLSLQCAYMCARMSV